MSAIEGGATGVRDQCGCGVFTRMDTCKLEAVPEHAELQEHAESRHS